MTNYIGIPTVNNVKYLQQTLSSLKTKYPHKVLLIDNGSNDGLTLEWIKTSGYEYIDNQANKGVAVAWNQIINWSLSFEDCESIFILNNDIVLREETLDLLIEDLTQQNIDGISGINIGNKPEMLSSFHRPMARWSPAMNFSCFGLTPRTIKRVGLFDENFKQAYCEDNDYHYRMYLEGIRSHCDMWAPFTHYGSRSIKEAGVSNEFFAENRQYFFDKWGWWPEEQWPGR